METRKASGNGGIERLSDRAVDAWLKSKDQKAKTAGAKLADGGGLYLCRLPSGRGAWLIRYGFAGKQRDLSAGVYPDTTLADAREARRKVKAQAEQGIDPLQERRAKKLENVEVAETTFAEVTNAWVEKQAKDWSSIHLTKSKRALERDVLPALGKLPISRITPVMVTRVMEKIEARGVRDTTAKIHQHVRSIFTYGQAQGLVSGDNPAEPFLQVMQRNDGAAHRPAYTSFPELGEVLRKAETVNITPAVRLCHRLIAFTAVRISNAVAARWEHFDLDSSPALWVIPRDEMKVKGKGRTHPHKVVLPAQLVDALKRWKAAQPKGTAYLFPGNQGREHLSRESVEKALRVTMGLADKHSAHGWRAAFSTLAREETDFDGQLIDLWLDHVHASKTALAYDRGDRLRKRIELAKWWGDSLAQAERGAEVLPFKRSAA
jgi:integrase